MKKVIIIQARMGSTRFPAKVLSLLQKKPVLAWVVAAAKRVKLADKVIVATSTLAVDDKIEQWCTTNDTLCFRGSEQDVLSRYYEAASLHAAEVIVRLTADCPLLQSEIIAQVLYCVASGLSDYASNVAPPTWPDGLDCEAFTFAALQQAFMQATRLSDREHVTPYIRNNRLHYRVKNITSGLNQLSKHRWTIDTPEDLQYIETLLEKTKGSHDLFTLLSTIEQDETLIQPALTRNEGFLKTLEQEKIIISNFSNSQQLLQRALKVIPLGAQTFSKSFIQFPKNTAPFFLTHGQGGRVWDVDGNEYIDYVNALLPNILGYVDEDVNAAISEQLNRGISFSLSTELEIQLAEKLCEIIPSAEKVRFAKNGTDVTSAAIRLARAFTGRDKVLVGGYHGWQDWSIGTTTRNKGIPKAVSSLSSTITYNELESLENALKGNAVACLIMEPTNVYAPLPGYLKTVLQLCEQFGTLLVFDEIITGFRFAIGGAQEYFGVTPHLSCFGKALGNGMPISAIVGRQDIMYEMENIFFSGTFGGETLSLCAALATIEKIQKHKVIDHLWRVGEDIATKVSAMIMEHNLEQVIQLQGYAPWKIINFIAVDTISSFDIKTFFIQEMLKRGILISASHNICFAHNDLDKQKLLTAYQEILPQLREKLTSNTLVNSLLSPTIQPLFKIR